MDSTKNGKQLVKLRLALSKALDNVMTNCSHDKFSAAFPSLTRDHPQALHGPRDAIIDYLKCNCKEEFETILQRRDIPSKLNALDTLKEQECEIVLDPSQAIGSKALSIKKQELESLESMLHDYECENKKWMEIVQNKRREMKESMVQMEGFCELHLARKCTEKLESCLL